MARSSAVSRLCPEIENAGNWTVTGTWKPVWWSFVPRGLLHVRRDLSWDSSHYRGQIFAQHQSGQYWLQQFLSQFSFRDGCRILSRMVLGLGKSGIVSQTSTVSFWRGFVPQVRVSDTVPFSRCRSVFQSLRRRNDLVRKFPSFCSRRCVRVSSRSDAPDSAKRCKPSWWLSDKAAGIVRVLQQVPLQAVLAQVNTDCYSVDQLLLRSSTGRIIN